MQAMMFASLDKFKDPKTGKKRDRDKPETGGKKKS
jgi:hypothetical protein